MPETKNYLSTNDFDYELDEKFIAQFPSQKRDESKLLVMDKNSGECAFIDLFGIFIVISLSINFIFVINPLLILFYSMSFYHI